ncbi:hypothetical protein [Dyella sp. 2RAB6]|uniref:hypothetical protein n=1 Tax=Dyella sp. 2RAB6 TaxID=3232992 RepID=UPI003F912957
MVVTAGRLGGSTVFGRLGVGAAVGAASEIAAPVDGPASEYWSRKGVQLGTGAAFGTVFAGAAEVAPYALALGKEAVPYALNLGKNAWSAGREAVATMFDGPWAGRIRAQLGAVGDLSKSKLYASNRPVMPVMEQAVPNSFSGAAFTEGKFLHDITPRTNLEIYGQAISRTPSEAKEILLKIGHDADTLDGYNFVKLTHSQYERMVRDLGGMHFDAAYGKVSSEARSVSFANNIASRMANGESRVPVWVRPEVFESDEAIAQVLSHEIYEVENLRYDLHSPVSIGAYYEKVAPNIPNNLHFNAVKEGDAMLLKLRQLLGH